MIMNIVKFPRPLIVSPNFDLIEVADYSACIESAANHRHVVNCMNALHAHKSVNGERVIGTENIKRPELYAWSAPIAPHQDRTGYTYIMPIVVTGDQWLSVTETNPQGRDDQVRAKLRVGVIYRLNDNVKHQVFGRGDVVAMFMGSYPPEKLKGTVYRTLENLDHFVVVDMLEGLRQMNAGEYYAPRLSTTYGLMPDEVFIDELREGVEIKHCLVSDLQAMRKRYPWAMEVVCAVCDNYASVLDNQYPYHQSGCLCATCNYPNVFIGQNQNESN